MVLATRHGRAFTNRLRLKLWTYFYTFYRLTIFLFLFSFYIIIFIYIHMHIYVVVSFLPISPPWHRLWYLCPRIFYFVLDILHTLNPTLVYTFYSREFTSPILEKPKLFFTIFRGTNSITRFWGLDMLSAIVLPYFNSLHKKSSWLSHLREFLLHSWFGLTLRN